MNLFEKINLIGDHVDKVSVSWVLMFGEQFLVSREVYLSSEEGGAEIREEVLSIVSGLSLKNVLYHLEELVSETLSLFQILQAVEVLCWGF